MPTTGSSTVSMPPSLTDNATEFVAAAEATYCPSEVYGSPNNLL